MIYSTSSPYKKHAYGLFLVLLFGCTLFLASDAKADSYLLTATVPAPLPTQPALITSHHDEQHVTAQPILIQGTCSNDTAYVDLYRDMIFAGTVACQSGTFSILVSLLPGQNNLLPKAFSSTSGEGPLSPIVTLFYDALAPSSAAIFTVTPGPTAPSVAVPLFITADHLYAVHHPGESITWSLTILGGDPPYHITINWGDGTTAPQNTDQTSLSLTHSYAKPGYYRIQIVITDAAGTQSNLQLFALVKADAALATGDIVAQPLPQSPLPPWVAPAAVVAVAVVALAGVINPSFVRLLLRK